MIEQASREVGLEVETLLGHLAAFSINQFVLDTYVHLLGTRYPRWDVLRTADGSIRGVLTGSVRVGG
jgi:hypothetical protein